jgi:hypothetical protein
MVWSTDKLGGGASDGDSTIARRLQRLARDTAASNKEQQHKHDRGYIAQAPNLTRHPYGVSQKSQPIQPAARMSLNSGFALIVRACSSSVTACPDSGLARKKPCATSQRRSRRKSSCSTVSIPSATTRFPRA